MNKRQLYILSFIAILLLGQALYLDLNRAAILSVDKIALRFENYIKNSKAEINNLLRQKAFLKDVIDIINSDKLTKDTEPEASMLDSYAEEGYTVFVFKRDSLLLWTNNQVPLPDQYRALKKKNESSLVRLANGLYLVEAHPLELEDSNYWALSCIPIKYQYKLPSKYLENRIYPVENTPKSVQISLKENEAAVPVVHQGKKIFYLESESLPETSSFQFALLFFYGLGLIVFFIAIDKFSFYLNQRYHPALGTSLMIFVFFGLKLLANFTNFMGRFSELSLFNFTFEDFFCKSLGDFFINIFLLLWVIVFFYKQYKITDRDFSHVNRPMKYVLTVVNSFGIILVVIFIVKIFKGLILDSRVSFQLDFIFNLDGYSLPAIIGIILLIFGLFVLSQLMMETIQRIGLSQTPRISIYFLTTLLSYPFILMVDLDVNEFMICVFATFYLSLFDYYIDKKNFTLVWLVGWILIFSVFSATLLMVYSADKDAQWRSFHAEKLVDLRDYYAEDAIVDFRDRVKKVLENVRFNVDGKIDEKRFNNLVQKEYLQFPYLYSNYQVQAHVFDEKMEPLVKGRKTNLIAINDKYRKLYRIDIKDENLIFYILKMGEWVYSFHFEEGGRRYFFEIETYKREKALVYSELFDYSHFRGLQKLDDYQYAVYHDNVLMETNALNGFTTRLSDLPHKMPEPGQTLHGYLNSLYKATNYTVYRTKDNKVCIVERSLGQVLAPLTLFSYIFAVLIIFALLVGILNYFLRFIPTFFELNIVPRNSLRSRIQMTIIALVIISFIGIGYVTVFYFQRSNQEYHEQRAQRKTNSVLKDIQYILNMVTDLDSSFTIDQLEVKEIAKIHRMDINLYDAQGRLVKSDGEEIYRQQVISNLIAPTSILKLKSQMVSSFQLLENIGNLEYYSTYVRLDLKGKTLGYLGLPYYSNVDTLTPDAQEFISYLINAYVFLLLIAGSIALQTANSVTKPLITLGKGIKEYQLGTSKRIIPWKNKDEVGQLVEEFNKMVDKNEESARLLKQSEKESAWREMAQQVAHEIKNPLTPMKLSLQYLMSKYKANADDLIPTLVRVSDTLLKQIENLTSIATEFSDFATMPRAENQYIEIVGLVESVFSLFGQHDSEENIHFQMHNELSSPKTIYGDKNQLVRVFNNLFKNSIEAIPEDKDGKVDVFIREIEGYVEIEVRDNGAGIPEDKKPKVFVPHFTTKSSGTGIGLAMCKSIIESTNGKIDFESIVGEGTSFFIRLPIVQE